METIIEDQINRIIERKSRATQLDNLIQGYRLYARTEGKSPKTIRITTTAVTTFRDFLNARRFSMAIKVDPLYNDICYLERRCPRETRSNCPGYTRESPKAEEASMPTPGSGDGCRANPARGRSLLN